MARVQGQELARHAGAGMNMDNSVPLVGHGRRRNMTIGPPLVEADIEPAK